MIAASQPRLCMLALTQILLSLWLMVETPAAQIQWKSEQLMHQNLQGAEYRLPSKFHHLKSSSCTAFKRYRVIKHAVSWRPRSRLQLISLIQDCYQSRLARSVLLTCEEIQLRILQKQQSFWTNLAWFLSHQIKIAILSVTIRRKKTLRNQQFICKHILRWLWRI